MTKACRACIRNIAEEPWQEFPAHHGGALSKALVRPETTGSRRIDYRISTYRPMAYVERHAHAVQEQVYHVLDGEGLMEIDGERRVVRRHDVIFIPPGARHSIVDPGVGDLTFILSFLIAGKAGIAMYAAMTNRPKAYSYLRFSTPAQLEGEAYGVRLKPLLPIPSNTAWLSTLT